MVCKCCGGGTCVCRGAPIEEVSEADLRRDAIKKRASAEACFDVFCKTFWPTRDRWRRAPAFGALASSIVGAFFWGVWGVILGALSALVVGGLILGNKECRVFTLFKARYPEEAQVIEESRRYVPHIHCG